MSEPSCRIAHMPSDSGGVNQHSLEDHEDRIRLTTTCLASTDLTLLSSQYIHPPRDCTKAVSIRNNQSFNVPKEKKIAETQKKNVTHSVHWSDSHNGSWRHTSRNDTVVVGSEDHRVTWVDLHSIRFYRHQVEATAAYNPSYPTISSEIRQMCLLYPRNDRWLRSAWDGWEAPGVISLVTIFWMLVVWSCILGNPWRRKNDWATGLGDMASCLKKRQQIAHQASSFSKISSLSNACMHLSIGTFPFLPCGIGNCKIENTLYVVDVYTQAKQIPETQRKRHHQYTPTHMNSQKGLKTNKAEGKRENKRADKTTRQTRTWWQVKHSNRFLNCPWK